MLQLKRPEREQQAQDLLLKAVGEPMYPICLNYQYTYVSTKVPWPRPYPGEALDRLLAQPEDVDVVARLQKCAEDAAAEGAGAVSTTVGAAT